MDERAFRKEMGPVLLAMEAVLSALARRAIADPAFSSEVTLALVESTDGLDPSVAAHANALARRITGEH